MRTASVVSSAADTGGSRRRCSRADARPELAGTGPVTSVVTRWLLVLVALGAFVGALVCASSAAASSHHDTVSMVSAGEGAVDPHAAGHGAHRAIERSSHGTPATGAPATDEMVEHPGLACVVTIDLASELVQGELIAGEAVDSDSWVFAGFARPPEPPVPRCSVVLAS